MLRTYTCNIELPFYNTDETVGVTMSAMCVIPFIPVYLNGQKVGDAFVSRRSTVGYLYESFYIYVVIQTEQDSIVDKLESRELTVTPISELEGEKEILKRINLV